MSRTLLSLLFLIFSAPAFAQSGWDKLSPGKIMAQQIIQRVIDSSGGDSHLDTITSLETVERLIEPSGDTLFLAVKRKNFNCFYVSSLSKLYENFTIVYNKDKAVRIAGQKAQKLEDPFVLERYKLQSFICREYGYKKLGYKLERKPDETIGQFDLYTVLVTSPSGYATVNYYDKKTGHPAMIVYPDGHRNAFPKWYLDKNIYIPLVTLEIDTAQHILKYDLFDISCDQRLDPDWFHLPAAGDWQVPEKFKTGNFKLLDYGDGEKIVRDTKKQTP